MWESIPETRSTEAAKRYIDWVNKKVRLQRRKRADPALKDLKKKIIRKKWKLYQAVKYRNTRRMKRHRRLNPLRMEVLEET